MTLHGAGVITVPSDTLAGFPNWANKRQFGYFWQP